MLTETQFVELYTSYRYRIDCVCSHFTKNEVEDWTSEIFTRIWEKRDQFRSLASPYSWAYRIAMNLCLQKIRVKHRDFCDISEVEIPVQHTQFNYILIQQLLGKMKLNEATAMASIATGIDSNTKHNRNLRFRGRQRAILA